MFLLLLFPSLTLRLFIYLFVTHFVNTMGLHTCVEAVFVATTHARRLPLTASSRDTVASRLVCDANENNTFTFSLLAPQTAFP